MVQPCKCALKWGIWITNPSHLKSFPQSIEKINKNKQRNQPINQTNQFSAAQNPQFQKHLSWGSLCLTETFPIRANLDILKRGGRGLRHVFWNMHPCPADPDHLEAQLRWLTAASLPLSQKLRVPRDLSQPNERKYSGKHARFKIVILLLPGILEK